jgi:hypothetical protein
VVRVAAPAEPSRTAPAAAGLVVPRAASPAPAPTYPDRRSPDPVRALATVPVGKYLAARSSSDPQLPVEQSLPGSGPAGSCLAAQSLPRPRLPGRGRAASCSAARSSPRLPTQAANHPPGLDLAASCSAARNPSRLAPPVAAHLAGSREPDSAANSLPGPHRPGHGPAANRPTAQSSPRPPPQVANHSPGRAAPCLLLAMCAGTVTVRRLPACDGRRGREGCRRRGCPGTRTSPCRPHRPVVGGGRRVLRPRGAGGPLPVPGFRPPRYRTPGSCRSPPRPGSRGGDTKAPSPTP